MEINFLSGCIFYLLGFALLMIDHHRKKERAKLFTWRGFQFLADIAFLISGSRFFYLYVAAIEQGMVSNRLLRSDIFTYFFFPVFLGVIVFFLSRYYAISLHFSKMKEQK